MFNSGSISREGTGRQRHGRDMHNSQVDNVFFILRPIIFQDDKCLFALFLFYQVSLLCALSSQWWLIVPFQRGQIGVLEQKIWQQLIFSYFCRRKVVVSQKWSVILLSPDVLFFFQMRSSPVYLPSTSRLQDYNLKTSYSKSF